MIQAAARYGYGDASVARVVEQAGVSRATFYEHFADKEDCFLTVTRELAAQIGGRVEEFEQRPPSPRVFRDALACLLAAADAHPAAARVSAIEALAAEADVRQEHEKMMASVEASIEHMYARMPAEWPRAEIPTRALLGGVGSTVAVRTFRGETGLLTEMLDDLLVWTSTYVMPPGSPHLEAADWEALGASLLAQTEGVDGDQERYPQLPRGRSAVPWGLVASEQRLRILAAVALKCRERGYRAMTVAEVVAAAGVSREAFYEQFHGKEDAFLTALTMALQESLSAAAGDFFAGETWPDRVWSGLRTMLGYMAANPDLVWVGIVESYAAGSAAIVRAFDNRMAYTLFLEEGYRQRTEGESLPRLCSEAIGGAILELIRKQAMLGRSEQMLAVLPQAAYVAIAPFTGAAEALELIREKCQTGG
jgi:AcrR family transcriptional regulator